MSLVYQGKDLVQGRRPGLYLGGKSDAKNLAKLQQWRVTHVLNMTPKKDSSIKAGVPNYHESEFTYHRIPIYDLPTSASELVGKAEEICDFIAKGLLHGSVLVHCQKGVSRSSAAIMMYLMRRVGMNLDESRKLVTRRRPQAAPIPAFMTVLEEYEKTCQELASKSEETPTLSSKKRPRLMPAGPQRPPATDTKDDESPKKAKTL